MRPSRKQMEELRCSFCHKSQDVVGKIISSPSDYPRAYICDECIAVCNSILEEDRGEQQSVPRVRSFREHPRAVELLDAVESWINLEMEQGPHGAGGAALGEVRRIAYSMKVDGALADDSSSS